MRDLTIGHEGKQIFVFALPMLLGNVFQQLYNIVDTIIIGQYIGKDALAAAGASFPVIFVLVSLVIGITIGTNIIIAQYYGAKDIKNVKKAIDTTFIFLFFASLILTILGLTLSEYVFRLISLPEDLIPMAMQYFNVYAAGLIFMFMYNATSAVLRGLGDSMTPLYFLIISTILNIIFDLVFVLVFNWGVSGVAFATVLAQAISFFMAIVYLNRTHKVINFHLSGLTFDRGIFAKSIKIGVPSGLQHTFVALGMMALISIVNAFGTATIAAYTIAVRIDSFAAMPAMNLSRALSTFVGQNIGAGKIPRVRKGLIYTLIMTSIISIMVTLAAYLFGSEIMGIFTSDKEVIGIGHTYLIIVSSFYLVFSAMFVTNGVLRGAGDTLASMFITLLSLWVLRIPLSYLLSESYGATGIWWGIPIAWIFGLIASLLYYRSGRWKSKAVVKQPLMNDKGNEIDI